MPQFDTMTFFNQVFWLILIVFNFYVVVVRFILPSLAFSLKSRSKNLRLTEDPKARTY
uniref:ATPase subunit 8 n=1 Tax=Akkesiphycus lubricus TaxID=3022 RepID=A0A8F0FBP3_AKKLU|nr:ATPase subunit 8 [Akkesiphycus lubricus]